MKSPTTTATACRSANQRLRRKGINPDNVFCCTLTGDSMEEKIAEDAAIAVDTGETAIRDGKIYAFAQDGMFRVKYLIRQPGNSVLIRSHKQRLLSRRNRPFGQPVRYRQGILAERVGFAV
ncbi:putative phage repressor protein [Neisseria gonorrhoeae]|nr:putative phage repressor protein [Neisseria gonorrhoeae]